MNKVRKIMTTAKKVPLTKDNVGEFAAKPF